MSSRLTYANAAAVLVDWIAEQGGEAEAIEFIAAWLADAKTGEHNNSMQALCDTYALNWGLLAAWIRKEPERDTRYRQAMADRGAMRKERLLDGWWKTAALEPAQEVSHGDVHKAREALAKAEGVFAEGKGGVQLPDGGKITIIHESQ